MTTTSSPWSPQAAPPAAPPPYAPPPGAPILPPAMSPMPPAGAPGPQGFRPSEPRRPWAWIALALLLAAVVAAAVGSTVTYVAMRNDQAAPVSTPQTSSPSSPAAPQFSQAETDAAKQHVCQVFDVSVRGQEGQGGLRVQGNLNVPVVLRSLNSASAVQEALAPAVPPDVASAADKYISATFDQTTAVMGNPPASEVNRLTDIRNDAINGLLDVCGLPR